MKTISIARDFTLTPFGVYREDSNYSAEKFREEILIPAIRDDNVNIDLSGTCGYGASWLQGVFGTLYTCNKFTEEYLDSHLEVYVSDQKDKCYLDAVHRYIDNAKKFNVWREAKKSYGAIQRNSKLDEQLAKLVKAMDLIDEAYNWFSETNWHRDAAEDCMAIQRKIGQLISDINDIRKLKEKQQ